MAFDDWNTDTVKNDGGSKYLKLKEKGDTATIRVGSTTYIRLTAYNTNTNEYEDTEYVNSLSPSQFNEEFGDSEEYRTRAEYIWVVFVRSFNGEDVNEAQVYAAPPSIRDAMRKFAKNPKWGSPDKYDFEVSRLKQSITDKGDEFYSVTPDPEKKPMTKDEKEKVEALEVDIEKLMPGVKSLEVFEGKKKVADVMGDVEDVEADA